MAVSNCTSQHLHSDSGRVNIPSWCNLSCSGLPSGAVYIWGIRSTLLPFRKGLCANMNITLLTCLLNHTITCNAHRGLYSLQTLDMLSGFKSRLFSARSKLRDDDSDDGSDSETTPPSDDQQTTPTDTTAAVAATTIKDDSW